MEEAIPVLVNVSSSNDECTKSEAVFESKIEEAQGVQAGITSLTSEDLRLGIQVGSLLEEAIGVGAQASFPWQEDIRLGQLFSARLQEDVQVQAGVGLRWQEDIRLGALRTSKLQEFRPLPKQWRSFNHHGKPVGKLWNSNYKGDMVPPPAPELPPWLEPLPLVCWPALPLVPAACVPPVL